jgi:DNA-binding response OmpR family regulator
MGSPEGTRRILVVDDEDLIRWALTEGLGAAGYSVTALGTARGALDAADAADLVLLDWRLPDSDGLLVARGLRAARPERPVILMTAYGTPEVIAQAAAIGVCRVLLKPFDLEDVVPLVQAALREAAHTNGGAAR